MNPLEFLQVLVDQSLCYGLKSADMDLYDFGFGNMVNAVNSYKRNVEVCTCILHITCRFKVIWKTDEHRIDKYDEDTPCEIFHAEIKRLVGLKVRRVGLSNKNDLWLDFGDCWVAFATFEDGEESWRFFIPNVDIPHLVASDSWIEFQG